MKCSFIYGIIFLDQWMCSHVGRIVFLAQFISVPDKRAGCCLGPEGNGVGFGEGGEGGAGPPESREDKQSMLSKGRDNMDKDEEGRTNQT